MVRIILYLLLPWYCREYVLILIGFNDVLGPSNNSYIAHIIPRIWAEKKEELISLLGNDIHVKSVSDMAIVLSSIWRNFKKYSMAENIFSNRNSNTVLL